MIVDVIIPALNEELSIGKVVRDIRNQHVRHVVVVDNGSKDQTAKVAKEQGAVVLSQPVKGYGGACLQGISWIDELDEAPQVVLFMDGDYSDYAEEMPLLIEPIEKGLAELVIGSRALGTREKGSMTPQQVFGNWLATTLMRILYKADFTDLGPYRAITYRGLKKIGMVDTNYGWTVEMQVKAVKHRLKFVEVPVNYRKRIGKSKVAGTLKGTILAGYKIILTIFRYL